jgi:hydrogenase/urease accessory protein HupE
MRALFAALLFCVACRAGPAAAHDSRPLFIELTESAGGGVDLRTTAPNAVDRENAPHVTLKEPCIELRRDAPDPRRQRAHYDCAIGDAAIVIDWPAYNPSISTLVRATYADGQTRTAILEPSETEWQAPAPNDFEGVARSYFRVGVGHFIGGVDHLLFLAGLLIIAGNARRTLVTVTGFTLAHSLTLALVALNFVRVSVPATEAVIAMSIVFLAVEIARGDRTTIAWRRPILVAAIFGLVHGAGFAAALGEIGLPKSETVAALLFFNVGVEAGQIALVAGAYLALAALRKFRAAPALSKASNSLHRVAGYALGIVSANWFIQRVVGLFAAN